MLLPHFPKTRDIPLCGQLMFMTMLILPAIDILKSGTRKEELLIGPEILQKVFILRSMLHKQEDEVEALKFLYTKMRKMPTNEDFLNMMNEGN